MTTFHLYIRARWTGDSSVDICSNTCRKRCVDTSVIRVYYLDLLANKSIFSQVSRKPPLYNIGLLVFSTSYAIYLILRGTMSTPRTSTRLRDKTHDDVTRPL